MSYYAYDDDYDDGYDPVKHMMMDPVDFQINGYGGFGYHTSHVPADGKHSALAVAAEAGIVGRVQF
jgi:hypothetical protein